MYRKKKPQVLSYYYWSLFALLSWVTYDIGFIKCCDSFALKKHSVEMFALCYYGEMFAL